MRYTDNAIPNRRRRIWYVEGVKREVRVVVQLKMMAVVTRKGENRGAEKPSSRKRTVQKNGSGDVSITKRG